MKVIFPKHYLFNGVGKTSSDEVTFTFTAPIAAFSDEVIIPAENGSKKLLKKIMTQRQARATYVKENNTSNHLILSYFTVSTDENMLFYVYDTTEPFKGPPSVAFITYMKNWLHSEAVKNGAKSTYNGGVKLVSLLSEIGSSAITGVMNYMSPDEIKIETKEEESEEEEPEIKQEKKEKKTKKENSKKERTKKMVNDSHVLDVILNMED